ncbi:hypothetical protein BDR26DRAFT_1014006 [Obelidium mucronatum]|nr:hypothetical protein BDR26DRAFT_879333 [Obelidium mucronatum]KAI9325499.1 hypothetical protein BDR26DRAFT_1014006 [Obelidium mucronatum]
MASATTLHESEVGANESFGAFRFNLSTSSNLNDGAEGTPAIPEFVDPSPPPPTGTDSWFKWMTKLVFRHQGKIAVLETRIAALNTQAAVDRAQAAADRAKIAALETQAAAFQTERAADRLQFEAALLRMESQIQFMQNNCTCGASRQGVRA